MILIGEKTEEGEESVSQSEAKRLQFPSLGNEKPIPKLPGRYRHEILEVGKASEEREGSQVLWICGRVSGSSFCGCGFCFSVLGLRLSLAEGPGWRVHGSPSFEAVRLPTPSSGPPETVLGPGAGRSSL